MVSAHQASLRRREKLRRMEVGLSYHDTIHGERVKRAAHCDKYPAGINLEFMRVNEGNEKESRDSGDRSLESYYFTQSFTQSLHPSLI